MLARCSAPAVVPVAATTAVAAAVRVLSVMFCFPFYFACAVRGATHVALDVTRCVACRSVLGLVLRCHALRFCAGCLHKVINGYSEIMRDVFGPKAGVGARSAVGMVLPRGIATEIEAIWELHDDARSLASWP
jgi:hypothetical protein